MSANDTQSLSSSLRIGIFASTSLLAIFACEKAPEGSLPSASPSAPSASPSSQTNAPLAAASAPPKEPLLVRKSTPAARKNEDLRACSAGDAKACRHMADRYRGYGHPAGCGIERGLLAQAVHTTGSESEKPAFEVRIKRMSEDTARDAKSFMTWIAKACDLGDAEACQIERIAKESFEVVATDEASDMGVRSGPDSSALFLWQKATSPPNFSAIEKGRAECVSTLWSCTYRKPLLYQAPHKDEPKALSKEIREHAEAICEKTLDCQTVLMMLDKNGYTPKMLEPVRAHAAKVLIDACLEGDCVCGDATGFLPFSDPRLPDLAKMGCENGEAEGCYALGRLYEEGQLLPKDPRAARYLYEIACPPRRPLGWSGEPRLGDYSPRACDRLAELYEAGSMPPKDIRRALFYSKFACLNPGFERDHAPCVRLARYWAAGATTSSCVRVGETRCPSNFDETLLRFYGPTSPPVEALECERPSVKALCNAHDLEINTMAASTP